MSAIKLDPPQVSTPKRAALSARTEAQLDTQPAALIEAHPQRPLRIIQPQQTKQEKQPLSFCPTCQMLLKISSSHPLALKCKKCGYKQQLDHGLVINAKQTYHHNEIAVIDKEEQLRTYPIVQATCEKCGKTKSETWTVAVGSEGATSAWVFL